MTGRQLESHLSQTCSFEDQIRSRKDTMKGRVRILKTSFTGRLRGASGDPVEVKSVVSHKL